MKKYILIAGVNGAGKSTLYQTLDSLKDIKRVNIDEIVRENGNWHNPADVMTAGKQAIRVIKDYFDKGISFNQETTLCGNSILKNIDTALNEGYVVELHYVGVDSVDIAKQRIAYRVEHGGHGIPDKDVERRYTESFINLKKVIGKCDMAIMYDNTNVFNRFAVYEKGRIVELSNNVPKWYTNNFV